MAVYIDCAAPKCGRPVRRWSRFCSRHANRLHRYGAADGVSLKVNSFDVEMAVATRYLHLYRERPAVAAAVSLADDLMGYVAESALRTDVNLAAALRRLKDAGTDPAALVMRCVAFALALIRKVQTDTDSLKARIARSAQL
jgi:hypothetical protein